jgi:hypothetical protein
MWVHKCIYQISKEKKIIRQKKKKREAKGLKEREVKPLRAPLGPTEVIAFVDSKYT